MLCHSCCNRGTRQPPPACFLLCRWVCSVLSGGAAIYPCVCLIPGQLHPHIVCALTQSGEAWLLHQGPSVFLLAHSWRAGSWAPDPILQPKLWEEQEVCVSCGDLSLGGPLPKELSFYPMSDMHTHGPARPFLALEPHCCPVGWCSVPPLHPLQALLRAGVERRPQQPVQKEANQGCGSS